jgi:SAM-dependent methyltransferase
MAELGARVVAFDFSESFVKRAEERTKDTGLSVQYAVLDARDEDALLALGEGRFDAAVCTMALMDMAEIESLFRGLAALLKPEGRFVFSVAHPCFHSAGMRKFSEMYEESAGRHVRINGVKILSYITPKARKTEGIIGQPEPQYYFHRPLQDLFRAGFEAGFVIDGLLEAAFGKSEKDGSGLRWDDMPEIPPVLVVRMRPG